MKKYREQIVIRNGESGGMKATFVQQGKFLSEKEIQDFLYKNPNFLPSTREYDGHGGIKFFLRERVSDLLGFDSNHNITLVECKWSKGQEKRGQDLGSDLETRNY